MTGRELYQLYVEANLKRGIEVDLFEDLDDDDQAAWNEVTEKLEEKR